VNNSSYISNKFISPALVIPSARTILAPSRAGRKVKVVCAEGPGNVRSTYIIGKAKVCRKYHWVKNTSKKYILRTCSSLVIQHLCSDGVVSFRALHCLTNLAPCASGNFAAAKPGADWTSSLGTRYLHRVLAISLQEP
jgi:hypothetical protein